jgi:hypothetical protein
VLYETNCLEPVSSFLESLCPQTLLSSRRLPIHLAFTVPLGNQIKLYTLEEQTSLISYKMIHEKLTRFFKTNFENRKGPAIHPVSCNFSLLKEDEVQFYGRPCS